MGPDAPGTLSGLPVAGFFPGGRKSKVLQETLNE